MRLSRHAEALIAEFARQQGLPRLSFDADGLIPIRLGGTTQIAIGYSPANDELLLFAVVDPAPGGGTHDPWGAFSRNVQLSARRTRLAIDPATGALIMSCDVYVQNMDFRGFSDIIEQFVADLEAIGKIEGQTEVAGTDPVGAADHMIFRA